MLLRCMARSYGDDMISEEALALRGQLIKARANISARVQELKERAIGIGRSVRDAPPHYRSLIAELEGQLKEINSLR